MLADSVDPTSDHLIARIGGDKIHVDFSGDTGNPTYGIPINVVAGTQARVPVDVIDYPNESDLVPVPIPDAPSIENWFTDTPPPALADMNAGDHHLLIAVRDEATGGIAELFELFQVWHDASGWHAASLSRWDLKSGLPRPDGWTSSDAAGLPRVPMMIRFDECRAAGGIKHPLAITFGAGNCRNRYIWPARHAALNGPVDDGIPYGGRLRLRQDWYDANKDRYTSDARVIVEAMRVYGVMNVDIAVDMFLLGISDSRFSHDNLMTLQDIPADAFEVLKMTPAFRPTGPATLKVGETGTYSLNLNPFPDPSAKGYYIHAMLKGANHDNALSPDYVPTGSQIFTFTPRVPGDYQIVVDQSGEYKLEWSKLEMTTGNPYPEFVVNVT